MHWAGPVHSPLLAAALYTGSQQGLCHHSYTYGCLLFIQVRSDATPMHCSTGQGKIHFILSVAALQNSRHTSLLLACLAEQH